jgi:hypothetical protein
VVSSYLDSFEARRGQTGNGHCRGCKERGASGPCLAPLTGHAGEISGGHDRDEDESASICLLIARAKICRAPSPSAPVRCVPPFGDSCGARSRFSQARSVTCCPPLAVPCLLCQSMRYRVTDGHTSTGGGDDGARALIHLAPTLCPRQPLSASSIRHLKRCARPLRRVRSIAETR